MPPINMSSAAPCLRMDRVLRDFICNPDHFNARVDPAARNACRCICGCSSCGECCDSPCSGTVAFGTEERPEWIPTGPFERLKLFQQLCHTITGYPRLVTCTLYRAFCIWCCVYFPDNGAVPPTYPERVHAFMVNGVLPLLDDVRERHEVMIQLGVAEWFVEDVAAAIQGADK